MINIISIIIATRPRPAFGRLGLGDRWEGTLITGTLITPRLAPAALGSVKKSKNCWKYARIPAF